MKINKIEFDKNFILPKISKQYCDFECEYLGCNDDSYSCHLFRRFTLEEEITKIDMLFTDSFSSPIRCEECKKSFIEEEVK